VDLSLGGQPGTASAALPRYFRFGRFQVNPYKVFLCVGIYSGIVVSSIVAEASGISPVRMGAGALLCAVVGLVGARVYYLAVSFRRFPKDRFWAEAWNPRRGGLGLFGGLVIVPFSLLVTSWVQLPMAVFWDHLSIAIVVGGIWIRFGCVCNGCCRGRGGIPVRWLEIGWWILAGLGLFWLWPRSFPSGSYALGVLAWYGLGRFWLEPLRAESTLVGRIRIDQFVAALLAVSAGGGLLLLTGMGG
jgi:phosphatidylglycerol:prolipoprotein diacylglycerol transferase